MFSFITSQSSVWLEHFHMCLQDFGFVSNSKIVFFFLGEILTCHMEFLSDILWDFQCLYGFYQESRAGGFSPCLTSSAALSFAPSRGICYGKQATWWFPLAWKRDFSYQFSLLRRIPRNDTDHPVGGLRLKSHLAEYIEKIVWPICNLLRLEKSAS